MNNIKKLVFKTQTEEEEPPTCPYRYLSEVQVSAVLGETVTLSYVLKDGTPQNQSWIAGGSGEEVYHTFGVGACIVENSVGIDEGNIINIIWLENQGCCP